MDEIEVEVEEVRDSVGLLALAIRRGPPSATFFVTPPELNLQVGFIVYPDGGEVPRHSHENLHREIDGTHEVLVIRQGSCIATLYDERGELVRELKLSAGDVIVLVRGGHAFRMLEDTVFLEVKQGPYPGTDEKQRF